MVQSATVCLRTACAPRLQILTTRPSLLASASAAAAGSSSFPSFLTTVTHPQSKTQSRALQSSARLSSPPARVSPSQNFILSAQSAPLPPSARSSSTTSTTSTASSTQSSQQPPSNQTELTWDRYLQLRTIRRRYNTVASGVTALGTTFVGAGFIASQDPDSLGIAAFGLDPIIVMGMATMACGAVGWVLGPFAGSAVWSLVYRGAVRSGWYEKEKDFYRRVVKYRTTPTGQSVNNPVPDYYGEKISSVKDYRRWLKDQRIFKRKRDGFTRAV